MKCVLCGKEWSNVDAMTEDAVPSYRDEADGQEKDGPVCSECYHNFHFYWDSAGECVRPRG